ncbi:YceI family protein [Phenylobacterium sp.]|uniref:YceI family protein n=1 Tax=Phenylobacterium sp. TaxID=1871053 RepID=UPI00273545B9|nr:YceI family protein [Phenylobacterium sp.]MDP3852840.1 YceI family protein [Phenylobacterium sp.]
MRPQLWACALLATVAACSPQPAQKAAPPARPEAAAAPAVVNTAPPGAYVLDRDHTSVTFRVNHLGLSRYTARFTKADGDLQFDPANPAAMSVSATIDPRSLETDYPDAAKLDFDGELAGPNWLDAAKFPQMTFKSTKVEVTGANTAKLTGDLTLHGVTRPVTLDATFNGGLAANAMDPKGSRIGFSARGGLKRSEFGVSYGVPAPGSNFGVGDDVEVIIETEFTQLPSAATIAPGALPVPKPKT